MAAEIIRPHQKANQTLNEIQIQITDCKQPAAEPKHPSARMLRDIDFTFHFLPQEISTLNHVRKIELISMGEVGGGGLLDEYMAVS